MSKRIHIVSFDVPFPPDYGGVQDVYFKIKALHDCGITVVLHCFDYGRGRHEELNNIAEVHYYKRSSGLAYLFNHLPYIVCTRNSTELLNNLIKDNSPVLLEGLHSCYFLERLAMENRKVLVRMHNIEHDYYRNLASSEPSLLKKIFFRSEAKKLERFLFSMNRATFFAAISEKDCNYIKNNFSESFYLPPFHANDTVTVKSGKGDYALYHGNLSVAENIQAALFLINDVFSASQERLIIAGSNPHASIIKAALKYPNIKINANVSANEINTLIENAQVNVLPTFQSTGIKLKLLSALHKGRHCLVNPEMVEGTGVEELCSIASSPREFRSKLSDLMKIEMNSQAFNERKKTLNDKFSNRSSAQLLIKFLFS